MVVRGIMAMMKDLEDARLENDRLKEELYAVRKTLEQREEEMDEVIKLLPDSVVSGRLADMVQQALNLARGQASKGDVK